MKTKLLLLALFNFLLFFSCSDDEIESSTTPTISDWKQIGSDIYGEETGDRSGSSVRLSAEGSIVAIGATFNNGVVNDETTGDTGHVRVYKNVLGTWVQIGSDIDGEAESDMSGGSISLSSNGNIIAIGALRNDANGTNSGHARVYENVSGTWTQIGSDIDGEEAGDELGSSISLSADGNILAVGLPGKDAIGTNSGAVRVFENLSGTWTLIGNDIVGEAAFDISGLSVTLSSDGSIVAIGAPGNDGSGNNSGHVRVYKNTAGAWTQIGVDIDGEAMDDASGEFNSSLSLSSDGSILAIGSSRNDSNGVNSGHARVFKNISGTWAQIGDDIDGEEAGDRSAQSVSLSSDGSIIAIGAVLNAGTGTFSGHVRIYKNVSDTWTQIIGDIDGESSEQIGSSVSLSSDGSVLATGAPANANNGYNSGRVGVYESIIVE